MIRKIWRQLKVAASTNQGFTLLETMIAMMILAVGVSAVLYMEAIGIDDHIRARNEVGSIQSAVMQAETIVKALLYNDETELTDDGANSTISDTYNYKDMPVKENHDLATYCVRDNQIVDQVKMIYMSNKPRANGKKFTANVAMPNLGRVR